MRRGGRQSGPHEALVRAIVLQLNCVPGMMAWRNDTGVRPTWRGGGVRAYGTKGAPDVLAVRAGHLYGLEAKTGTSRRTPVQEHFHAALRDAGATVGVVRSVEDALALVMAP